jgi:hypothetical protein
MGGYNSVLLTEQDCVWTQFMSHNVCSIGLFLFKTRQRNIDLRGKWWIFVLVEGEYASLKGNYLNLYSPN